MNALFGANKPAGISSNQFLTRLKRKYKLGKCGYSGTLDPFASGLLLVGVGAYTRLFDYLDKTSKVYEATLWLGAKSESLDIERVSKVECVKEIDERKIQEVFSKFVGEITYTPPKFSAKHIGGKRAYELARDGVEFELQKSVMSVFELTLLSYNHPFLSFRAKVSEGSYIRSLGELIARELGCNGALSKLKRIEEGSVKLGREELVKLDIFSHLPLPQVNLSEYHQEIANGKKITLKSQKLESNTPYLVVFDDFFSIIEVNENGEIKYRLNRIPKC